MLLDFEGSHAWSPDDTEKVEMSLVVLRFRKKKNIKNKLQKEIEENFIKPSKTTTQSRKAKAWKELWLEGKLSPQSLS